MFYRNSLLLILTNKFVEPFKNTPQLELDSICTWLTFKMLSIFTRTSALPQVELIECFYLAAADIGILGSGRLLAGGGALCSTTGAPMQYAPAKCDFDWNWAKYRTAI